MREQGKSWVVLRDFRSGGRTYRAGDPVNPRRFLMMRTHIRKGRIGECPVEPQAASAPSNGVLPETVVGLVGYLKGVDDVAALRRLHRDETKGRARRGALLAIKKRMAALEGLGA